MLARRTYILLISSVSILIAFFNIFSIVLANLASLHQRVAETHVRVAFFNHTASSGRYIETRRQLGLTERLVFRAEPAPSTSLLLPTIFPASSATTRPLHRLLKGSYSKRLRFPLLKRATELTVLDAQCQVPKEDDAWPTLRLTQDSSWEYSNSKKQILETFSISAQRDFEEDAALELARRQKLAARNRRKMKKKKVSRSSTS
ncbi:hypothetical protein PIIN_03774 [Serendipita indica DSM 11827]|uniref:Uncharacterized protein n=1 Tax=Serendipita indica (strain DSM 11827) TaxID=1109443 RepID=G4TES9_SERID|nr:hypothetical protein PIIN_03774 [Serendipita indica DSM 11827]